MPHVFPVTVLFAGLGLILLVGGFAIELRNWTCVPKHPVAEQAIRDEQDDQSMRTCGEGSRDPLA